METWLVVVTWAALAVNIGSAVWSWRRGTQYWRAHRVLLELCLGAWPLRGHRALGANYLNTIGRWCFEDRDGRGE